MSFVFTVALLALLTALTCSVPGMFLVVAKRAVTVDALSHAMLPGIVFGFLLTESLSSPLLLVTAVAFALLTIAFLNTLVHSGRIARHSTMGLVLPPLLAMAVTITTLKASDLHLDTHTVLLGDLNLIAFDELCFGASCYGPQHLYLLLILLACNLVLGLRFQNQIAALIFDREFAQLEGLKPGLFNTLLLFFTALTVTAAFAATGAVLVLAFMILPAAAARLVVSRLRPLLPLTLVFSGVAALSGFTVSYFLSLPTSAGISAVMALEFLAVLGWRALWQANRVR